MKKYLDSDGKEWSPEDDHYIIDSGGNIKLCQCGCGKKIKLLQRHLYDCVPRFISGHTIVSESLATVRESNSCYRIDGGKYISIETGEVKMCECGCGEDIPVRRHHKFSGIPDYVHGHNGRYVSDETRGKISRAHKNREFSEEHCQKISKAKIGHEVSKETRNKISKANTGYRHTEEAKRKIGESGRGEKNHNWDPDLTDEERERNKSRHSDLDYVHWRQGVIRRDNYTCQACGERGGRLQSHHIRSYTECPELRYELGNGITLCEGSHKEFHCIFGRKGFTKGQLWAYIIYKLNLIPTCEVVDDAKIKMYRRGTSEF